MIRLAEQKDIPRITEMGRAFYEESKLAELVFDEESTRGTIERLIESGDGVVLVSDHGGNLVGMAAAVKYPHYMNASQPAAQELVWWVEPEFRGGMTGAKLLRRLEDWARTNNCASLTMICLPIDGPAESIYRRAGYRALERSYIKGL